MDGNEGEYRVVFHQKARLMLSAAFEELVKAGWEKGEIERLASDLELRLRKSPREFGEPHFTPSPAPS